MRLPPLAELYGLLRADGFSIGADDHVRIGRLLAREAAWTIEMLRISVAALVVADPQDRAAFDACWQRWLRSPPPPPVPPVERPELPAARPRPPRRMRWVAVALAVAAAASVAVVAMRGDPAAEVGGTGAGSTPPAPDGGGSPAPAYPPPQRPPPPSRTAIDLALVGGTFGAIVLALAAIAAAAGVRARRRFVSGPGRYALVVPPATRPVLPRAAIEDAAADLTWQAPEPGHEIDVARSVAATVARGGFPTIVPRRPPAAPRYVVLEDTVRGAEPGRFLYDELLRGLAREGVAVERYTFCTNLAQCSDPDGRLVSLDDLLDHSDALIAIGDGAGAVDPVTGERAAWLASLRRMPRRLWINPVAPARWSAGAKAIAADIPMEHGVAHALSALAGTARRAHPEHPYPAVIERAPGTASAIAALRTALGDRAFLLVAAVAVMGSPTIAAARWVAETHALALDEHAWLRVAALPWFGTGRWPDGLRDGLGDALCADAPDLAAAIAVTSERLFLASEPPRASGAHLAWQLEDAYRTARRGERAIAARVLNEVAATPFAHQARGMLAALGLPDRGRRARMIAAVVGAVLVLASAGAGGVAARLRSAALARRAGERHLEKLAGDGSRLAPPTGRPWPEVFVVRVVDGNGDPVGGARIAWSDPQLGPRSYIAITDAVGLSRAAQLYPSAPRDDLQQVAQLITTWNGAAFTDEPTGADGDKVVFRFAQVAGAPPLEPAAGPPQVASPTGEPAAPQPAACPGGTSNCSGRCVDLAMDRQNCGTCGARCARSEMCVRHHCVVVHHDRADLVDAGSPWSPPPSTLVHIADVAVQAQWTAPDDTLAGIARTVKKAVEGAGYVTIWPGGAPTQAELTADRSAAFLVASTIRKVEVTPAGQQMQITCELVIRVAPWAGTDGGERWEANKAAMASGSAKVTAGSSSREVAGGTRDCLEAVAEDVTVRQILPFLKRLTAPSGP